MGKTTIEWTDYSWNPIRGKKGNWHCSKVSPGCENCYAEALNKRFSGLPFTRSADGFRLDERKLKEPHRWPKDKKVFVCSMTDLFHEDMPKTYIFAMLDVMRECQHLTFQVLTKRTDRMRQILVEYYIKREIAVPFKNLWTGTSVEDQKRADERIPILMQLPGVVKWLSCEPLLGPVDLWSPRYANPNGGQTGAVTSWEGGLHWIVVGGESGSGARPMNPDWVRKIRDECQAAGVAYFFKQWGAWSPNKPENFCRVSKNRYSHESFAWSKDGSVYNPMNPPPDHFPDRMVYRTRKKDNGNTLDGKQHLEFPTVRNCYI